MDQLLSEDAKARYAFASASDRFLALKGADSIFPKNPLLVGKTCEPGRASTNTTLYSPSAPLIGIALRESSPLKRLITCRCSGWAGSPAKLIVAFVTFGGNANAEIRLSSDIEAPW